MNGRLLSTVLNVSQERMADWTGKFHSTLGLNLLEVTGDTDAEEWASMDRTDIICTTPEKFGQTFSRNLLQKVSLHWDNH